MIKFLKNVFIFCAIFAFLSMKNAEAMKDGQVGETSDHTISDKVECDSTEEIESKFKKMIETTNLKDDFKNMVLALNDQFVKKGFDCNVELLIADFSDWLVSNGYEQSFPKKYKIRENVHSVWVKDNLKIEITVEDQQKYNNGFYNHFPNHNIIILDAYDEDFRVLDIVNWANNDDCAMKVSYSKLDSQGKFVGKRRIVKNDKCCGYSQ